MYKKVMFALFTFLFLVLYMFSIAVVIMFMTSALHIVNPELFPFQGLDSLTVFLTIFILVVSARAFLKIYKKYSLLLEDIISRKRKGKDVSGRE